MTSSVDIRVPDIGDFKNVPVIEVLVSVGSRIGADTPLVTLESDKATLEVPAPMGGTVDTIVVRQGERVSCGDIILRLIPEHAEPQREKTEVASADPVARLASHPQESVSTQMPRMGEDSERADKRVYAGPAVRALSRMLDVELASVSGSGPRGRILKKDVLQRFRSLQPAETSASAVPAVDFGRFGPIDRQPLSRIQRISGARLARSWSTIPHVTNFDEADISALEEFRVGINASSETKITLLAFLIKACALTLTRFPIFKASLAGDEIVLKKYCHIGFAVDTPNGLLVPVVRDVEAKGVLDLAREAADLAQRARAGKLKLADMEGGCFSVSSLGGIGGVGFTPIINAPEVAILGAARARILPRWEGDKAVPRLIMPLSLSWDHRAIDGAAAARFLGHLCSLIHDVRRWVL